MEMQLIMYPQPYEIHLIIFGVFGRIYQIPAVGAHVNGQFCFFPFGSLLPAYLFLACCPAAPRARCRGAVVRADIAVPSPVGEDAALPRQVRCRLRISPRCPFSGLESSLLFLLCWELLSMMDVGSC